MINTTETNVWEVGKIYQYRPTDIQIKVVYVTSSGAAVFEYINSDFEERIACLSERSKWTEVKPPQVKKLRVYIAQKLNGTIYLSFGNCSLTNKLTNRILDETEVTWTEGKGFELSSGK